VKRAAAFFVAPACYALIFLLWRRFWSSGLLFLSLPALAIFPITEYLIVRAGWDRLLSPFARLGSGPLASAASALVRGTALCIPAVVLLKMMRSLAWTAVFIPFVYESQMSLFASRAVLLCLWTASLLLPFLLFILIGRFRTVLSVYVPLALIFGGFLNIYNSYDRLVGADANLDAAVEVLLPRERLLKIAGADFTPIARDIYVEDGVIFASFGTTVSPATSFVRRAFGLEAPKRAPALVRYDMRHGWADFLYGGTVKYIFSRPTDEHLYFAIWSDIPQIFEVKKRASLTAEPVTPLIFDLIDRWDSELPLLSIMDIYVDRARRYLYFSADELPACFRVDLESDSIVGEVNLLKRGLAPWGAGVRRIHVDPEERFLYMIAYASPVSVVKIGLDRFDIAAQRPAPMTRGMYRFYHEAAFDWDRGVGYGFPFDGASVEAFRLSDLMTIYEVETGLAPMRLQVRGAHVLDDGRVVLLTYFGEIFLFDPDARRLHLLCSRTGGRADDLAVEDVYIYLNNYAGLVRIPLARLLARIDDSR